MLISNLPTDGVYFNSTDSFPPSSDLPILIEELVLLVTSILAAVVLLTFISSKVPIPTSAFVIEAVVAVKSPTNELAVMIPVVFASKVEDITEFNTTFPVASKETADASIAPVIEKSRAVSNAVASEATPVKSPVTFPVTSPAVSYTHLTLPTILRV